MSGFESVIGLEVHVQLNTKSKIFCRCPAAFGAPPNANTCPVCLGMPGVLPVLNGAVVTLALRAALALNCRIAPFFKFDRKNYFYPDLPKAYQISQYDLPIGTGGHLDFELDGKPMRVGIERIHIEEDAGKLVHAEPGHGVPLGTSFVDLNRAGTPLVEIVSRPDLRAAKEAAAYLMAMRQLMRYIGVSECNMEEGSMRCDANVSVRPRGSDKLGTRAEVKNINSFRFVEKAIDVEFERQVEIVESGGTVVQETRGYDSAKNITLSQRSKEEAHDYRYFPEPDLPGFVMTPERIEAERLAMPELPAVRRARFASQFGLPDYDVRVLSEDRPTADYFEAVVAAAGLTAKVEPQTAGVSPKKISNFIMTELLRELKTSGKTAGESPVSPAALADLLARVESGKINGTIAKDVFSKMFAGGKSAEAIIGEEKIELISDASSLDGVLDEVIRENPAAIEDLKGGKGAAVGFLVGQVMKKTRGQANPKIVQQELRQRLEI